MTSVMFLVVCVVLLGLTTQTAATSVQSHISRKNLRSEGNLPSALQDLSTKYSVSQEEYELHTSSIYSGNKRRLLSNKNSILLQNGFQENAKSGNNMLWSEADFQNAESRKRNSHRVESTTESVVYWQCSPSFVLHQENLNVGLSTCPILFSGERRKSKKRSDCSVTISGHDTKKIADVSVICGGKSVVDEKVKYDDDKENVTDTSKYGFTVFERRDGEVSALTVYPNVKLVLTNVSIKNLHGLRTVFLVGNATLVLQSGSVSNIYDGRLAGAIAAANSTVTIANFSFTNTHAKRAGVLAALNSTVNAQYTTFKGNSATDDSLVLLAHTSTNLSFLECTFTGALPHSEDEHTSSKDKQASLFENFDIVGADVGVVYVAESSSVTFDSSVLAHFGSLLGTIFLEKNSTLTSHNTSILHNIAIYGGGVFSDDSTVYLKNSTLARNAASRGGAVLLHGTSQATFQDVVFKNNLATEGAGINIEFEECQTSDSQRLMSISNCTFIENVAYSYGGAIYSTCVSLNVSTSIFSANHADVEGGAIYTNASHTTQLTNVEFLGNTGGQGGAVLIRSEKEDGNVTLENGTFAGNKALRQSGGAISFFGNGSTLGVSSFSFNDNEAAEDGGAMHFSRISTLRLLHVSFSGNKANNGSAGALYVSANRELDLKYCEIASGKAANEGGGLYLHYIEHATLTDVNISNNKASRGSGGGVLLDLVGNLVLKDANISGNEAGGHGGGISYKTPMSITDDMEGCKPPSVKLSRAHFSSNKACSYGGGISVDSIDTLDVVNCSFDSNEAQKNGGGVYVFNATSVNIAGTNTSANAAPNGSGGCFYGSKLKDLKIKSSTFDRNSGGEYGGAVHVAGVDVIGIQHAQFTRNNVSHQSGGALALFGTTDDGQSGIDSISFEKTVFSGNTAQKSGGAVCMLKAKQTLIVESTFSGNAAIDRDGGALCFTLPSKHDLNSTDYAFEANKEMRNSIQFGRPHHHRKERAPVEQNLDVLETTKELISLKDPTFKSNSAGRSGGAIYLQDLHGDLTMDTPTFDGCTARKGSGGCVYFSKIESFSVIRGHFTGNNAKMDGGCFYLENVVNVDLNESRIEACTSYNGTGGAIYMLGNATSKENKLLSESAFFLKNTAANAGACLINQVDTVILDASKFLQGKATKGSGGGAMIQGARVLSMQNLTVNDNEATESCGVFCISNVAQLNLSGDFESSAAKHSNGGVAWLNNIKDVSIGGSYIKSSAHVSGGVFYILNVTSMHINDVNFGNNEAGEGGGAIATHFTNFASIRNSTFTENEAVDGGALLFVITPFDIGSVAVVENCGFIKNKARKSGGGAAVTKDLDSATNTDSVEPTGRLSASFLDSQFQRNEAKNGGGLGILAGDVYVNNTNFTKNDADGKGGAMYLDDNDFVVVNNTLIDQNTADKGGALVVNFTHALVSHNTAPRRDDGALIACEEARLFVANVTFVHNFRNHKWYFYIIFPLTAYGILFFYLALGIFLLRCLLKSKVEAVTYDSYSAIGEPNPEPEDLTGFFGQPMPEIAPDDEAIVSPKPPPSLVDPTSTRLLPTSTTEGDPDPSDGDDDSDDAPIPQHRLPPTV